MFLTSYHFPYTTKAVISQNAGSPLRERHEPPHWKPCWVKVKQVTGSCFILYHLPDEEGRVQVVIKDETIWATQKAMAQLFGVDIPAISKHLTHIFDEGELDKEVVVSKMEITTQHGAIEGKTQKNETTFYSLDAIIAVGYREQQGQAPVPTP